MSADARKVMGSFGWVALSRYINRFLGFVTTLVLAKLLVPEDFGLVALAAMVIEVLKLLKDMGLGQALIHRRDEIKRASDTAFFLLIGVNLVLFVGAVAASPWVADFFDNREVMPVLIVMSSNLVWFSFRAVPDALVRKGIDFRKLIVPEIAPAVLGAMVAIIMAYQGYGVWSLVVKSLIVDVLGTVLIWRYTEYRPSLSFDRTLARELFSYGKHIVVNSIFLVIVYNIDRFYISKVGGVAMLGLYTLAFTIANLPTTELGHVVCRVMFPVFAQLNQDLQRLRQAFLRTLRYAAMIVVPVAFGIAIYGPPLVDIFYGPKWAPMSGALQALCFYAMFRALSAIMHELYKAQGRPWLAQRFTLWRLAAVGLLGVPAVANFGLLGMAVLLAVVYGAMFLWEALVACRHVAASPAELFRVLVFPTVASLALVGGIYLLLGVTMTTPSLGGISAAVILTGVMYLLALFWFDKTTVGEIRQLLGARKSVA